LAWLSQRVIKLARHYGFRDDDLVSMLETMLQPEP
jgi:hypothetical protein